MSIFIQGMIPQMNDEVFRNEEFLSAINNSTIPDSFSEFSVLHNLGNNWISLGGWEFNISRSIHPSATFQQIERGWNGLIQEGVHVDVLFLCLFIKVLLDNASTKIVDEEPELIEIIRLCYWYDRCSHNLIDGCDTFCHKKKEIRGLLGKGVRTSMGSFLQFKLDYDRTDFHQYYEEVKPMLYAITHRKAPKGFVKKLTEFRHTIYSFVSELIFYALVVEESFSMHFINYSEIKSPDCFVDNKSAEVKGVMDEISYQDKIEKSVYEEVIGLLKRSKVYIKINEGLRKANIIALDVTGSSLGYSINQYSSQNHKPFLALEAIRQAIDMLKESITINSYFIPIIVFAQSYSHDKNYQMSVITIRCPVTVDISCLGIKVDLSKIHV